MIFSKISLIKLFGNMIVFPVFILGGKKVISNGWLIEVPKPPGIYGSSFFKRSLFQNEIIPFYN